MPPLSSSKQLDIGRDDDPLPRLREEPAAALISACGGCFDDPAVSGGDDTAERMAVDRRRAVAAADSRATALRNDTAAGRRRRIRSSVFFRRPDTVRRRSATTRTTADRAPRVRRPAAAGRLAPGSPTPAGTSGRLRDVSSGSLAGSDVRGAGSPAMSAERRRQLEVVVGDREEWRMEFGRAETFDVSR